MSNRPVFSNFKKEALKDEKVKAEYDGLSVVFERKRQMLAVKNSG